jgi:hypothetical protein
VEVLHPGMVTSDVSHREVPNRDDSQVILDHYTFGYRFYDRNEYVHPDNGETLRGSPQNYSAWRYEGELMTLEEVKTKLPTEKRLIANMENNDYSRVCKTKFGQFIPVGKDDIVLKERKDVQKK